MSYKTGTLSEKHVTITMPAQMASEVEKEASERGLSISSFIRMKLIEARDAHGAKRERNYETPGAA